MTVLVTGGLGYIGSHVVVELQTLGYDVIIVDDLSNSSEFVLTKIKEITGILPVFEKFDLKNKEKVIAFFKKYKKLDGIIHFAASKAVAKSVEKPLAYYENNLNTLIYLLSEYTATRNSLNFIFSSSCTVYGDVKTLPIKEDSLLQNVKSPYGNTKKIGEEIIYDTCATNPLFNAIILRYFNPIGAHPTKKIGELPNGVPQNLVPFITQTVAGIRQCLNIYGSDYNTKDGTCIRDYIHVMDLAKAHVIALERLIQKNNSKNIELYNVGTGKGVSVLDIVNTFEKTTKQKLNYKIVNRRAGDIEKIYADTDKISNTLNWKAKFSLEDALLSAWEWQKTLTNN